MKKSGVSDAVRAKSSSEWYTPKYIIDALAKGAGKPFDLDVCSPRAKHWTAKRTLTPKEDGLRTRWPKKSFIWCNPPYDFVLPWAEKMRDHALAGKHAGNGVMLVNVSGSAEWWSTLMPAATALLIVGERLRFVDIKGKPSRQVNPLTSVLIGFGPLGLRAVAGAYLVEPRLDGTFLRPHQQQAVLESVFEPGDAVWRSSFVFSDGLPPYRHGIDPEPVDGSIVAAARHGQNLALAGRKQAARKAADRAARKAVKRPAAGRPGRRKLGSK